MRPATSRATANCCSSWENCFSIIEIANGFDQLNTNAVVREGKGAWQRSIAEGGGQFEKSNNAKGRTMYRFLEGTVEKYMTRAVRTVTRQTTMRELEALFEKHDFNSFPVVEEGKMLGIVTKFDFLRAFAFTTGQMVPHYDELMRRPVGEMMTEAVVHVEPAAPLTRVLQLMVSLKSRSFPVIGADHQLVGMISREDVIRALKEATQQDD
jgi:CBS domain-containing protein